MSEHSGPRAPISDRLDRPSGVLRLGPRRIGDFLLVAQLGDDALGSVYRALHTLDGRFMRLRVLQSPELSPDAVQAAARRQTDRQGPAHDDAPGNAGLQIADGIPYLVWPDNNGWTLDFVLTRARAGGWALPVEFALLVAERAAAEIEKAYLSCPAGDVPFHGALWPGFVGISSDAEVRVVGFGLSEAIRPALPRPRMWRDVAPYIAPEVREGKPIGQTSDVYSIGVLLVELLTGRRASADTPPQRWRADDDFSQDVSLLLRFALADSRERFSSVVDLHESLKSIIAACPFEPSPADLALFLYDLLNPESRKTRTPFDGNSTNPLSADRRIEPASPATTAPARPFPPTPVPALRLERLTTRLARLASRGARGPLSRPRSWARAAGIAAAIAGLVLIEGPFRSLRPPTLVGAPGVPAVVLPAVPAEPTPAGWIAVTSPARNPFEPASDARQIPPRAAAPSTLARNAATRRRADASPETEALRLKVGLARIAAERLDAAQHAAEEFDRGREIEREAQQLYFHRHYLEARGAYSQALNLFSAAETLSRQERVRKIQLEAVQSR